MLTSPWRTLKYSALPASTPPTPSVVLFDGPCSRM